MMQPTQSNDGTGTGVDSNKFAALRHVTHAMGLAEPATPEGRWMAQGADAETGAAAVVAEGAGLAHDAGNLLGALSLYSDLLAMPGVLHEEHRQYAEELRMLSDRSWAMIDRLMNHARGPRISNGTEGNLVLPDVVDRCRGLLSRIAGRTIEVSYGLGAFQPVRVPLEPVERILTNLVKNAAEATSWAGAISIHVEGKSEPHGREDEMTAGRVVLTVTDRGCGMEPATARRLMEEGISRGNGRGLGFRVVRELVEASGGQLRLESQLKVGTSVSVEWCVAAAAGARG